MPDKTAIGISAELRQYIEALVEEVVLEGKPFEDHKKYLCRFCEAEGIDFASLETNLTDLFETFEAQKTHESKREERMARTLGKECFLSEDKLEQLISSVNKHRCEHEEKIHADTEESEDNEPNRLPLRIEGNTLFVIYGTKGYSIKGHLVIPPEIEGNAVLFIGNSAFYGQCYLTSVAFPNSIIRIGESAFGTSGLTSLIIPDSVCYIGECAFQDCHDLQSARISNSVSELSRFLFCNCKNLSSVYLPNSVRIINYAAFENCTGLESITIPDSVINIDDNAFSHCGLTSITIPSSVTGIGNCAFQGCYNLRSVVIPNSIRRFGQYVFDACPLKEITIGRLSYSYIHSQLPTTATIHIID